MLITIFVYLATAMSIFMYTIWKKNSIPNVIIKIIFLVISVIGVILLYQNDGYIGIVL